MTSDSEGIQRVTTFFSLFWLVMANLVGVLLAVLLIWPDANTWMSPFSYGRWIPLHLDWQLYGWCSLPLLGLIHIHFLGGKGSAVYWTWISFALWSSGLIAGGVIWLNGGSTGKLFLDWSGPAGYPFIAALMSIWAILAYFWLRAFFFPGRNGTSLTAFIIKGVFLAGLLGVPFILLYTSNPDVYPPVNPESGGATGHSLLASTLSLVFVMGILPGFGLGLAYRRKGAMHTVFWTAFLVSIGVYLLIEHGNASNHATNQILGLGTLLIWPGLVWAYWRGYDWVAGCGKWRVAFFVWWGFLALDGWILFLPGILDTLKFTNALVGHSHLAMAGMLSALNMLILHQMGNLPGVRRVISGWLAFWFWNFGCLLYVVVMTLQGWREGNDPQMLIRPDSLAAFYYHARLVAGIAMAGASLGWLCVMLSPVRAPAKLLREKLVQ